jgi:hypothetical protein
MVVSTSDCETSKARYQSSKQCRLQLALHLPEIDGLARFFAASRADCNNLWNLGQHHANNVKRSLPMLALKKCKDI